MKYKYNLIKNNHIFFIIILVVFLAKNNILLCETIINDISPEKIIEIKKMLCNLLKEVIETPEFINKYDKSNFSIDNFIYLEKIKHNICTPSYNEGQGSKVIANAYNVMNKNPEIFFDPSSQQLTLLEKNELLTRINNEDFRVGYISRSTTKIKDLPYLSGDDLHYFVVLPLPKGGDICFATITSNNDGNTYKFGDKQYANKNIQEQGKAEYCRAMTYLIYIDKDTLFIESKEHSNLVNKGIYNNQKIKDIFINAIKENAVEWKNNIIRKPISFTVERLNDLAISLCENNIKSWEDTNNGLKKRLNWNNLTEDKKQKEILQRGKQERMELFEKRKSSYRKLLPENVKKLFDEKEKLLLQKTKFEKENNLEKKISNTNEAKL